VKEYATELSNGRNSSLVPTQTGFRFSDIGDVNGEGVCEGVPSGEARCEINQPTDYIFIYIILNGKKGFTVSLHKKESIPNRSHLPHLSVPPPPAPPTSPSPRSHGVL